jgi:hypothetical protein
MGQTGGEFAERQHLLFLQVAGREVPRAVEHRVDAGRGQLVALANHLGKMGAGDGEHLGPLHCDDPPGRLP